MTQPSLPVRWRETLPGLAYLRDDGAEVWLSGVNDQWTGHGPGIVLQVCPRPESAKGTMLALNEKYPEETDG